MSEKVEKVLSRLGNIWPKRLDDDGVTDFLADWESALKPFEGWVIDAAATRLIQSRTKTVFPFPREMIDACNEVLADDRRSKPTLSPQGNGHGDPFKLADDLMRGELGRRAAREGWALRLRDFIADNHRLPDEGEARRLIKHRDEFVVKLRECIRGDGGLFGAGLADLGRKMVKREHDIAQRILGDQAGEWYVGKL